MDLPDLRDLLHQLPLLSRADSDRAATASESGISEAAGVSVGGSSPLMMMEVSIKDPPDPSNSSSPSMLVQSQIPQVQPELAGDHPGPSGLSRSAINVGGSASLTGGSAVGSPRSAREDSNASRSF